MKQDTLDFLLNLNREFYDTYAKSFSSTRYTIQPGIRRLLPKILASENVFDLGCGNGNLAKAMLQADFPGRYLGVDNSSFLLADAKTAIPENERHRFSFSKIDLADQFENLPDQPGFDAIACFAVIHHFPSDPYLNRFFNFAKQSLRTDGKLFFSTWQVKNNQRLKNRIQPWSVLDVSNREFSDDDLLMDWRADSGQTPRYRYVHHYDSEILTKNGLLAGLKLEEEFFSDGKEDNLALYQVWSKPRN